VQRYDFIVVGAGAAGLSLAYHLACGPLRGGSILLVDRTLRERADRTWAFWARTPTLFDGLIYRSWTQLQIAGPGHAHTLALAPYTYNVIRGTDFYRFTHAALAGQVTCIEGRVDRIEDGPAGARVWVGGAAYDGRWVFDSRFRVAAFHPDPARYHYLRMQFRGWEIATARPAFDPQTPIFLDFRTPQQQQVRFFYLLPYSDHEALIEYVACVPGPDRLLDATDQEQAGTAYMTDVLGLDCYRVRAREQGISPMTDYPFPRRQGRHIMNIGVAGGRIKPSTGFAFMRIQHDCAAIVRSLRAAGHPFHVPATRRGYRLYESWMLGAMAGHGPQIGPLLTTFFRYGSTRRILRFLDERGAPI
jgi:lycopene beta-cyclase